MRSSSHAVVALSLASVGLGVRAWDSGGAEVSLGLAHGGASKEQSVGTYIIIKLDGWREKERTRPRHWVATYLWGIS